jgi:hypothetical protein
LGWQLAGKRKKGWPRQTWIRVAKKELWEATGLGFSKVVNEAQDRGHWKEHVNTVRDYKAHHK